MIFYASTLSSLHESKWCIVLVTFLDIFLCREKSFQNPTVRQYAVDTLQSASDEELLTYLLQLVQALRYEPENGNDCPSHLASFPWALL